MLTLSMILAVITGLITGHLFGNFVLNPWLCKKFPRTFLSLDIGALSHDLLKLYNKVKWIDTNKPEDSEFIHKQLEFFGINFREVKGIVKTANIEIEKVKK